MHITDPNTNDTYDAFYESVYLELIKNAGSDNVKSIKITPSNIIYTDSKTTSYTYSFPTKSGTLALTTDVTDMLSDKTVVKNISISTSGDNVSIAETKTNLGNDTETTETNNIPLANDTTGGLMSSADYKQIRNNTSRIEQLEGQTTRLLYTASENPTASDINTFVTGLGYTSPFNGIAVVVDNTYHIWHYYENDNIGWRDDGADTVNQFTNNNLGTIKGTATDGKVYAETDGTGSVYGWDNLKSTVSDINSNLQNKANYSDIPTKTSELENDSGFSTFSGSYNDLTDKPTNLVTTDTEQTIIGKKKFSGNGLAVSGRANGSGDDEGIVVSRASNNYAGICLGDPSGNRSVMYLLPDNSAVWRFNDGSSSYNIKHPGKEGTIALQSDIPTSYLSTISKQATVYQENTNVEGQLVKIINKDGIETIFTDWTYFGNATTTENGLMSASDKAKLDNIDTQPRHYLSGDSQRNNGVFTYYKLASFPIDDSGNSCSLIINGRIGGWNKGNKGSISMIISNRDGVDGIGTILGNADTSLTDLVVYTNSDNTATLYVKTYSWFAFDLTLGLMSGTTDAWDGVGSTTTPSGTLAWSLSSAKSKFLSVADDGTTYVKGNNVATQDQLGTQATFSLSGTTLTITPK